MITRLIDELEILDVLDRGMPNKERIVIRTKREVELAAYFLILGVPSGDKGIFPINAEQFWFGDQIVTSGTWIFLYTGYGETRITKTIKSNEPALVLHWGSQHTIFNNPQIIPAIISAEGVYVAPYSDALELPYSKQT